MTQWIVPVLAGLVAVVPVSAEVGRYSSWLEGNRFSAIAQSPNPVQSNPADQAWQLIRAARRSAANAEPEQVTKALIEAEQTAGLLSDSVTLDTLLALIAAEQAKLGQYDRAIAITQRMGYTTMPLQTCCVPVRTAAEIAIAQAYLNAGQLEQARQFAEGIQFAPSRYQVLVPIVAYLAEQEQFTEAIALSQRSEDQASQARYAILKGYINADRFPEAVQFAQAAADPSERSTLLATLAQWAWRSGKNDLSYELASQLQEPASQAQAWVEVARAYASAGQPARAVSVLEQAYQRVSSQSDPQGLAQWADHFAQIGAFDRALAIANSLTGYEKAQAKVLIARAYSNAGRYAQAIALAQQVREGELQPFGDMPDLKVETLQQIVRQAVKTGHYDLALRAVNSLEQGQDRVTALRTIAQRYRLTQRPEQAAASLDQAITAAQTVDRITRFYDRNTFVVVSNAGLLTEIARDFLVLNQPERALAVLDQALGPARTLQATQENSVREQVQDLRAIGKLYAQLGQRDRALAAAESAVNLINQFPGSERSSVFPAWTVQPLAEVAQMFDLAGAGNQATEMLAGLRTVSRTISDPQQQMWGMLAIVKAYAAIGVEAQVKEIVEAALTLAQSLEPAQQQWLTERLAIAAASSDPADAIQLILSIPNRAAQLPTLAQLAVNYHATGQHPQAQAVVIQLQQVAETIPDDGQRNQGLSDAVRSYFVPQGVRDLSISQLLQAGQINADIQAAHLKAYNWFLIAQACAFQGEAGRASQTMQFALDSANTIPDRFEQRELLWQMLEEALQVEEASLAAQIATGFAEASYRTVALQRLTGQPASRP